MSEDDKCHFCGNPGTKLCDHPMKEADGFYHLETAHTCDLPICDDCSTELGVTFDMHGPGSVDTTDHCPFHSDTKKPALVVVK